MNARSIVRELVQELLSPEDRLSGKVKFGIFKKNNLYVAWTKVWEGPGRPDHAAAEADLRDRLHAHPEEK
jgi:hypothetical protein